MKLRIRLAVVGTGLIFQQYNQAINWLNRNGSMSIEMVAAVNRTEESNIKARNQYGISRTYTSVAEMMQQETVDGVLLLVPPHHICELSLSLLHYRVPLLIEKPPGICSDEARLIARYSEQFNTPVMVGFNRRFYSIVKKAKSIIDQMGGLLGMRMDAFERYRIYRENNMDASKLESLFSTNTIHCIDLIRFYTGDIAHINSFNNNLMAEPSNHRYASLIVSKSNIPVTFQAYWHAMGNWNYELYIPDGKIHFTNLEQAYFHSRGAEPVEILPDRCDLEAKAGFASQLEYFIAVIRQEKSVDKMSIHDAIHTFELVEQLKAP
ncbi:Inositol 2-dehydrogenase/D-chiro-inositol 3-dehydrogenase [Paenibacillus plantiphilus]|uniref:Inositol 2-dehydrogenase/D-chiro-inositol 3-dehydrogenase n=1 Tax=Paenibacillus plantiphilus TaxID=2905650 RepID=A0ABM9BTA5_9BACL|nr:Gfo/Idh/MocA family oxidoreductase [Paenibacillus plantiphilus]CAH1192853.1 Inositol 2-dehydrogenase/D-chiro-inositol 3-dehydrogenase [Paenibacillus plantiphilus]